MNLEFSSLPLVEVGIRLSYAQPFALSYELFQHLPASIPTLSGPLELKAFEAPPGIDEPLIPVPPAIAGAQFADRTKGLRVTLQSQLVAIRWNHEITPNAPNYPRFPVMKATLKGILDALAAHSPDWHSPLVVNMVYVNLVSESEFASPPLFIAPECYPSAFSSEISHFNYSISFQNSRKVDLTCDIKNAFWGSADNRVKGFRFATAAGIRPSSLGMALSYVDTLHEELQGFFAQLISQKAKDMWGLQS